MERFFFGLHQLLSSVSGRCPSVHFFAYPWFSPASAYLGSTVLPEPVNLGGAPAALTSIFQFISLFGFDAVELWDRLAVIIPFSRGGWYSLPGHFSAVARSGHHSTPFGVAVFLTRTKSRTFLCCLELGPVFLFSLEPGFGWHGKINRYTIGRLKVIPGRFRCYRTVCVRGEGGLGNFYSFSQFCSDEVLAFVVSRFEE